MEVLAMRTMEGPNIYSRRPVIRISLDIGEYEDIPSNAIPQFNPCLTGLLPGLQNHHCSLGYPGGFAERLAEGTYLSHIFEHVALELQCMAGYEVNFGKTRSAGRPGVYDVVMGYSSAAVAREAANIAVQLLTAVIANEDFAVGEAVVKLRSIGAAGELGPSTGAICSAALKRNIPVRRVGSEDLLVLGYGCRQQRIWATMTSRTGIIASDLACDKYLTGKILEDHNIPVPYSLVVRDLAGALRAAAAIRKPVAVKPLSGNQGKGVTLGVTTDTEMERAFAAAAAYEEQVVVQEYIPGRQYRMCVVDGKMEAASERIPAYVMGDGLHTIAQLVDLVNANPNRGQGHEKPLTRIKIDAVAVAVLARQGVSPAAVPPAGRIVYIRDNANLSTGGTAVDVTDSVHPETVAMVELVAKLIGLDIAGIDIVATDITQPIGPGSGAVIEVNAAPGIRMHHYPAAGRSRDVAGAIVDYLYPDGAQSRIPIVAITGTNGKTTVSRMIGHIFQLAGYTTGMTTTGGIFIDGHCVCPGDTTGPDSARMVLSDPRVQVAVLETARGGIVRGGLAFDRCDVGIITNITEDHLGQDGIESLEDLAYIKSLITETVRPGGQALLNADDRYVAELAPRVSAELVYFSTKGDNILVRRHLGVGGRAFFVRDGVIYAACGSEAVAMKRVNAIPVTLGGIAQHNIQNALIAAAACSCIKIPLRYIRRGLATFQENPGRLNIIPIGTFRICVDYGHNPAGYQALLQTARCLGATRLVGVIAAPGDRRNDVILNIGRIAGQGFNYIYIKEDHDLRGRKAGETAHILRQGILEVGFNPEKISIVLDEGAAVRSALLQATAGDLIVIFYEAYEKVMEVVSEWQERCPPEKHRSGGTYKTAIAAVASLSR